MGCLKGKKNLMLLMVGGDSQIPVRQQMKAIGVVSNPFVGI